MDCAEVERRLWEYLDGALPPEEAGAVSVHMRGCGDCGSACRCCNAFLLLIWRALRAQGGAPEVLRLRVRTLVSKES